MADISEGGGEGVVLSLLFVNQYKIDHKNKYAMFVFVSSLSDCRRGQSWLNDLRKI